MNSEKRVASIIAGLCAEHPAPRCALDFHDPFQLLVSTILSAQCTDERVNRVTPALFARYPTPQDMALADREELESLVRPTGFYRNKAAHLIGCSRAIVDSFGGRVPEDMASLTSLPGVARKTANVVLGGAFGKAEGIAVDTHVRRLAGRMGLSGHADPEKVERDLMELAPRESWTDFSHRLILHGRGTCKARRPRCDRCAVSDACPKIGVEHE